MKKNLSIIAIILILMTSVLYSNPTTPVVDLKLHMNVAQAIVTRISDAQIPFVAQFDETPILTDKNVTLDNAGSPTDTQFFFNVMTNMPNEIEVFVKPVKFMRTDGSSSAIGYTVFETSKQGASVEAGLTSGNFVSFYSFNPEDLTPNAGRVLDSRRMIVEISNEDFQSASAGSFTATISFEVRAN